jgi:transposase-like protein
MELLASRAYAAAFGLVRSHSECPEHVACPPGTRSNRHKYLETLMVICSESGSAETVANERLGGKICPDCFSAFVDSVATTWLGISQCGITIPKCWRSGLECLLENLSSWSFDRVLLSLMLEVQRVREFLINSNVAHKSRDTLFDNTSWALEVVSMWSRNHISDTASVAA